MEIQNLDQCIADHKSQLKAIDLQLAELITREPDDEELMRAWVDLVDELNSSSNQLSRQIKQLENTRTKLVLKLCAAIVLQDKNLN